MSDRKSEVLITPPGVAVYPKLFEPNRKFKPEGTYECTVRFDPNDPEWAAFMEKVAAIDEEGYAEACKEAKKKVLKRVETFQPDIDRDTGEETGMMLLKTNLDAQVTTKDGRSWEQRPVVLDAKKNIVKSLNVGSGSTVRVKVEIRPYYVPSTGVGVSRRLKAVQILDLKEYSADAAAGFDEAEGYTLDTKPVSERGEVDGEF